MGKFVLIQNWKDIIGEFTELADAQAAANIHAGKPQKWKYNKKTASWYNNIYTIRFIT